MLTTILSSKQAAPLSLPTLRSSRQPLWKQFQALLQEQDLSGLTPSLSLWLWSADFIFNLRVSVNTLPRTHTFLHVSKLRTNQESFHTVPPGTQGMSLQLATMHQSPRMPCLYKMETELSQQCHDASQRGVFWNKGRKIISQETVLDCEEMLSSLGDGVSSSLLGIVF